MNDPQSKRKALFLKPGEGRSYAMGRMRALFKADGTESQDRYSISEWWLEPNSKGPGKHRHDEDDIFLVIEGVMSFLLEDRWVDAPCGSFILAPAGVYHDFENRSQAPAGVFNISIPGGFEENMPMIVDYFQKNPLGDARP